MKSDHPSDQGHVTSPLHTAAETGDISTLQTIIDTGADPNSSDEEGVTPLRWAADRGAPEIAQALIDASADPNSRYEDGTTPLHWATERGATETAQALIEAGADLNSRDEIGTTPLARGGPERRYRDGTGPDRHGRLPRFERRKRRKAP